MNEPKEADKTLDTEPAVKRLGPDGKPLPEEAGGPKGLEPTRYGDWEVNGRVSDF